MVTIWRHGEAGRAASDRLRELTGQGGQDVGFAALQPEVVAPVCATLVLWAVAPRYEFGL